MRMLLMDFSVTILRERLQCFSQPPMCGKQDVRRTEAIAVLLMVVRFWHIAAMLPQDPVCCFSVDMESDVITVAHVQLCSRHRDITPLWHQLAIAQTVITVGCMMAIQTPALDMSTFHYQQSGVQAGNCACTAFSDQFLMKTLS